MFFRRFLGNFLYLIFNVNVGIRVLREGDDDEFESSSKAEMVKLNKQPGGGKRGANR